MLAGFVVLLAGPPPIWTFSPSMLAPRRPSLPVQVLVRQKVSCTHLTTSDRSNVRGTKSILVADGQQWKRPRRTLKETAISTDDIAEREGSIPTLTMLSALQAPSASRKTDTVTVEATTSTALKADIEPLPGQNQSKPTLDDAILEGKVLPGVNQDTSDMGEVPRPVLPVTAPNPSQLAGVPVITVNKPLPGQNQDDPIMGEVAPPPAPKLPTSTSSVLLQDPSMVPTTVGQAPADISPAASSPLFMQDVPTFIPQLTSTSSIQSLAVMSSSSSISSYVTSFVTIISSEQGKLAAPVTADQPNISFTTAIAISNDGADTTVRATTQAIAAAQSVSIVMPSLPAVSLDNATPLALSDASNGSVLHPTARTLLVVFVILGEFCGGISRLCSY